jgi:hypothetical protein
MAKKLFLVALLWALPTFATDHPVSCGAGISAIQTAINAAQPGDTITIAANNGSQCNYSGMTINLPRKTPAAPVTEAVLSASVSSGAVSSCSVTSGGSGYVIAPLVRLVGGGGKGATAHAVLTGGAVGSCVVDNGGTGYLGSPTAVAHSPENYITIRTSQFGSLPGRRYNPANHATISPKLTFTSISPITIDAPSAPGFYDGGNYYRFQGVEFTFTSAAAVSVFANLAGGSHLIFDQNYLYAQPCPNTTAPYNTNGRIAFVATSYDVTISNNYVDCFWGTPPGAVAGSTGTDTMGVICDTNCEAVTIDNNYITAWFNGVFLGGSDPPPSPTGHAAILLRSVGSATLASPPTSVDLMSLELPFEGNTVPISSITRNNNLVTVVTSGAHGFNNGAYVYPKGVTDSSFNVVYDGNGAAPCTAPNDTGCRIITVDNSTTFHYTQSGSNASSSGGVIVPTTCQRGPSFSCFMDANGSVTGSTFTFTHGWVGAFSWGTFDVLAGIPNLLVKSGGDARWAGPQATNVDITRNQMQRNTTFDQWVVANNGNVGKGCPGEMKFWNGGLMEGNVCDGFPLNTPGFNGNTQYGSAPWVRISNVRIQSNWWRRFIGNSFTGFEYQPMGPGASVVVTNNLWEKGDNDNETLAQSNIKTFSGPSEFNNFTFTHNAVLTGFKFNGMPCTTTGLGGDCYTSIFGFIQSQVEMPSQILVKPTSTIRDNIMGLGNYGYQCGESSRPMSDCQTLTEDHNLLVSNSSGQCTLGGTCGWIANSFPWTNSTGATTPGQPKWCGINGTFPGCASATWSGVQFTDPQNENFLLAASSPGRGKASDGTDVGPNYATIQFAIGQDNPTLGQVVQSPQSLTVNPTSWTGNDTQGNTVSRLFTLTNPGPVNTSVSSISLTGSGFAFAGNNCTAGTVLPGGTNCNFAIQFFSTVRGTFTGSVAITDSAGGAITIPLSVTNNAATTFAVSPTAATINALATQQMTATSAASWVASSGTIDTSGLFTAPASATVSTVTATQQTGIAINLNTDPSAAWHNCGNCGNTGGGSTDPHGTYTITPGVPATFSIAPAQGFDNFFWWQVLGAPGDYNATTDFVLDFDMEFPTQADKNASQAIEFELQKNVLDHQYSMAWQICFACGNKLRVFNKTSHAWEDSGITFDPALFAGGKWASIHTVYQLTTGSNTRHISIAINGVNHIVNIDHVPTPAVEGDYLHPAFQMDANSAGTAYTVLLKNFNVYSPTGASASALITSVGSRFTLLPATFNFGTVLVGNSTTTQFTLQNPNPVPLGIKNIAIATGATNFSVDTANSTCQLNATIAAQQTCVISVRFAPGVATTVTGSLQVTDSTNGTTTTALSGTGVSNPTTVSITPASFAFGSVVTGSTVKTTFTISNGGGPAVTLTTIAITGTGFSIDNTSTCVQGALLTTSCKVVVAFAPVSAISYTGNLQITDNSPATSNLPLTGAGVAPPASTHKTGWKGPHKIRGTVRIK